MHYSNDGEAPRSSFRINNCTRPLETEISGPMVRNTAGLLGPHCFLRQVTIQVTIQHVGTCGDSAVTKHLTSHVLRRLDLDQLHANSTYLVRPAYPHRARAPQ